MSAAARADAHEVGGTVAADLRQQAHVLVLALLCLLSAPVDLGGAGSSTSSPATDYAMESTRRDVLRFARAVLPAVEALPAAAQSVQAILFLAMGLVEASAGGDARKGLFLLRQGRRGHALAALRDGILRPVWF